MEPSAQEEYRPVGAGPEGHKNDLRAGTPPLWQKAGVVQPGEEKAPGRPHSSLSVPERGTVGKMGKISLARPIVIEQGAMALNWGRVDLD